MNIIRLTVILLFLTGCSIIDLRKIEITTNPNIIDQVISKDEHITVYFNADGIKRKTAEQAVSIVMKNDREGGNMETDFNWDGSQLTVVPVKELAPGIRYALNIKGLIELKDGRSYTVDTSVPFFYITDRQGPYLESFTPNDNVTCSVDSSISLTFSTEIDKNSFEDNFSVSPSLEYDISWNGNKVVIEPENKWENHTRYTWSVTNSVTDTNGVPLIESYSHSIIVQKDISPPDISDFYAADFTGNILTPGQKDLNYLAYNDAIYMVFTEPVEPESIFSAFMLYPDFDGYIIQYSTYQYIFLPYQGWDFNTEYTLTIGTDLKDTSGNKIIEPIEYVFKPDKLINPVEVTQIEGNGDNSFSLNSFNSAVPVSADVDVFGRYSFSINFDTAYSMEYRSNIEDAVGCTAYFPANSEPVRDSVVWSVSGNRVTFGYTGFVESAPPHEENIYKLIIRGGKGTRNSSGGYVPADVYIYIRAE